MPDPKINLFSSTRKREIISILGGLALWEFGCRLFFKNELFLAPPSSVVKAFADMAASGEIVRHLSATFQEFVYGLGAAILVGLVVGYFTGISRAADNFLDPWIGAFYSVPIITIVPLIIIWFGLGIFSKVIVVFLITVVAIIVNTGSGIKSIERSWFEVAQVYQLGKMETLWKVTIPAALPFLLTGIRLAVGRALLGVVVAELMASQAGLGFLLRDAAEVYDTARLLVAVVLLSVIGVGSFVGIRAIERRIAPWREQEEW